MEPIRRLLRRGLAAFIVTIPSAYILWQWANVDEPILTNLSYASFNGRLTSALEPPFWTYALWVFLVFVVMLMATALLDWALARVFPDVRPPRK